MAQQKKMLYPFDDENGRRGFIDADGNVVIAPCFEMGGLAGDFYEGRAKVCENGLFGFIDLEGQLVVPCRYRSTHVFSSGRAWVLRGDGWGIIDPDGCELCSFDYWAEQTPGFHERHNWLAAVRLGIDGKYGYLDRDGEIAIPFAYDAAGPFWEERASVRAPDGNGCIDPDGQLVIELQYGGASRFSEGLASVSRRKVSSAYTPSIDFGKAGLKKNVDVEPHGFFIDKQGNIVFEHDFDYAGWFVGGRAKVDLRNKTGFIDNTGTLVIPTVYAEAEEFLKTGVALVQQVRRWHLIDRDGNRVGEESFDDYYFHTSFDDELLCVQDKDRWGFIDTGGQYVIEPRFAEGVAFHYDLAYVCEEKPGGLLTGYINRHGEYIWQMMFKES